MKLCEKCGVSIDEDVKFCPHCGASQEQPPDAAENPVKTADAEDVQQPVQTAEAEENTKKLTKLRENLVVTFYISVGAIVVSVFMPWISLGKMIDVSIMDISKGLMLALIFVGAASAHALLKKKNYVFGSGNGALSAHFFCHCIYSISECDFRTEEDTPWCNGGSGNLDRLGGNVFLCWSNQSVCGKCFAVCNRSAASAGRCTGRGYYFPCVEGTALRKGEGRLD